MSGAQGAAERGTVSAEAAGRMVEDVLDRLAAQGDPAACEAAEELVRALMQFYGAGLARIVELLPGPARTALLDDDVVASLLVLHDLHPADVRTRIARALRTLPHPVETTGFDPGSGTLRLRLTGSSGCGCGSTREAVEQAARDALAGLAPEVTEVRLDADTAREPVLLQIGSGPPGARSTNGRPAGRAS